MNKIDFSEKTVRHVANLARLELSDNEVSRFSKQIGDILGYVEKLNSVDTSKIEPMYQVVETAMSMRDDVDEKSTFEEILACAPEHVYENFKVPQVIASKDETE